MLKVACVYRSGGDYNADYVRRLHAGVEEYLQRPHEFICLTDRSGEIEKMSGIKPCSLRRDWPGWWSKMELFAMQPPILYFDLDTVICGDIGPVADVAGCLAPNEFLMLRDFYRPCWCSAIMAWNTYMGWLFKEFCHLTRPGTRWQRKAIGYDLTALSENYRGDQDFISAALKKKGTRVILGQEVFAGIHSYKVDVLPKSNIPKHTKIICFHGLPRPHEVPPESVVYRAIHVSDARREDG